MKSNSFIFYWTLMIIFIVLLMGVAFIIGANKNREKIVKEKKGIITESKY